MLFSVHLKCQKIFEPAQEALHELLHQLPQPEPAEHSPGPEVSPEVTPLAPQGQAPHHPALQTPAWDQLRGGTDSHKKTKNSLLI